MGKSVFLAVLLCVAAAGFADAGQFRIAPPANMRKRQPPANYRESRLEIVNRDNRGYAIDIDYRANRLSLAARNSGDIYLPANSSIILTFDDDDDWRIEGDYESLAIEIRSGRTTTLRLETKTNRNQIGLVGTVDDGRRQYSKQLFRYADRPGVNHRSSPQPQPPRQQPNQHNSRAPQQQPSQHNSRVSPQQQPEPPKGAASGKPVDPKDNDRHDPRR